MWRDVNRVSPIFVHLGTVCLNWQANSWQDATLTLWQLACCLPAGTPPGDRTDGSWGCRRHSASGLTHSACPVEGRKPHKVKKQNGSQNFIVPWHHNIFYHCNFNTNFFYVQSEEISVQQKYSSNGIKSLVSMNPSILLHPRCSYLFNDFPDGVHFNDGRSRTLGFIFWSTLRFWKKRSQKIQNLTVFNQYNFS